MRKCGLASEQVQDLLQVVVEEVFVIVTDGRRHVPEAQEVHLDMICHELAVTVRRTEPTSWTVANVEIACPPRGTSLPRGGDGE